MIKNPLLFRAWTAEKKGSKWYFNASARGMEPEKGWKKRLIYTYFSLASPYGARRKSDIRICGHIAGGSALTAYLPCDSMPEETALLVSFPFRGPSICSLSSYSLISVIRGELC
jgi:hypothetical protein